MVGRLKKAFYLCVLAVGVSFIAFLAKTYNRNVEPASVAEVCETVGTGKGRVRIRTDEVGLTVSTFIAPTYDLEEGCGWTGRCENGKPVGKWTLWNSNNRTLMQKDPVGGELRVTDL